MTEVNIDRKTAEITGMADRAVLDISSVNPAHVAAYPKN